MSKKGKFILSVDDGCVFDLRVAEIAKKYGLEVIFYWPVEWRSLAYDKGYEPLNYLEAKEIAKDFEIGGHTVTHQHLTSMNEIDAHLEIKECKEMLERLFDTTVTKFCPPRGYTNEWLTKVTMDYFDSQRLTKGPGLVHVHPNSGANNNMPWREYAATIDVEELWGHSWEFDKFNLWDELEEYIKENLHG